MGSELMSLSIDQVLEIIGAHRIIAIVRLNDLSAAIDLSRALIAGGVGARPAAFVVSELASVCQCSHPAR